MFLKKFSRVSNVSFVRYKNPPHHWSVLRKKSHPIDKALNYFDEFYKGIFDPKWISIRKALLGKQKYVAVVNNFGDDQEIASKLELKGAINVRTLYQLEKQYIYEEGEKNRHNEALEKIFKLDEQMELEMQSSEEIKEETKPVSPSLDTGLKQAQIDTRRLIDTRTGASTDTLAEFIPATIIKGKEDFISESTQYQLDNRITSFNIKIEREHDLHFPEHLKVYCYEEGNNNNFDPPKTSSTGVVDYYLMDGGSILPVLALGLKPGNRVLDMCAGPGGKSLLCMQTLYPEHVTSNDVSASRLKRVRNVYQQFLYDFDEKWLDSKVSFSNSDARWITNDKYDRILVDVPCTTDRHSLQENDNNIFKPSRIKERLKLPELQKDILFNALKLLNKGGVAVYSTCSLNPIQNDGVVRVTLRQIWEETNIEIVVKDLSTALLPMRRVYQLADKSLTQFGHLVLPSVGLNYGPTYFCKLQRLN